MDISIIKEMKICWLPNIIVVYGYLFHITFPDVQKKTKTFLTHAQMRKPNSMVYKNKSRSGALWHCMVRWVLSSITVITLKWQITASMHSVTVNISFVSLHLYVPFYTDFMATGERFESATIKVFSVLSFLA